MQHLDEQTWALLDANDPLAVRHFAAHLSHPCETCETFLAGQQTVDGLDGTVDAQSLPRIDAPLDEVGFARLRRRQRGSQRWAVVAGAIAVAAVVVAGVLPVLRTAHREEPGVKGSPSVE